MNCIRVRRDAQERACCIERHTENTGWVRAATELVHETPIGDREHTNYRAFFARSG